MLVLTVPEHAAELAAALGPEARLWPVPAGQAHAALAQAAGAEADRLVLDLDLGDGLAGAVSALRGARPALRVALYAAGRAPGDPEAAAVVRAGVFDVATDPQALAELLARPTDYAAGAAWLQTAHSTTNPTEEGPPARPAEAARAAGPGDGRPATAPAAPTRHRVVAVASKKGGVGKSTVAANLAAAAARLDLGPVQGQAPLSGGRGAQLQQPPAGGLLVLVAGDEDGGPFIARQPGGVERTRATHQHPGAGHDDGWRAVQHLLALFRMLDGPYGTVSDEEGVTLPGGQPAEGGGAAGGVGGVHAADRPHETVDANPSLRGQKPPATGIGEDEQHLLRPAQGEGRDQAVPTPLQHRAHLLHQAGLLGGALAVQAVAVGALQDQRHRPAARRAGGPNRPLRGDRDVAADQERALRHVEPGHGCPEDMAGGPEGQAPAGQQRMRLPEGERTEAVEERVHLRLAIRGQVAINLVLQRDISVVAAAGGAGVCDGTDRRRNYTAGCDGRVQWPRSV